MNRSIIAFIFLILSHQLFSFIVSDHQRSILQRNFLSLNMAYDNDLGALIPYTHPLYKQLYQFISALDQPSIARPFIKNNSQEALLYYLANNSHLLSINKNYLRISHPIQKNDYYYVEFKINPTVQGQLIIEIENDSIKVLVLELLTTE